MHYDPMCVQKKHKCQQVCVSVMCRVSNPFVCKTCKTHQSQTCQIMPYKKLIKQFHKTQGLYTSQMLKYQQRVQNTFSQLMGQLKQQFITFREQFQHMNIHEKVADIYMKIKNNKQNQLTAQKMHWAMKVTNKSGMGYIVKNQLQMRMHKQNIVQIFAEVLNRLPPYYSLKNIKQVNYGSDMRNQVKQIQDKYVKKRKLTAGIMGDYFQYLQQMMKKDIYNIQLLYRATENNFSATAFHKKCDGMVNTVFVAQTQYDKIVIGFCPFPWQSPNNWVYHEDQKGQCFLISPSKQLKGKKFTPMKTKFAIGMHKDYGPSFGDDFVIYDKANHSKNCWSNFPDVYVCKISPVQHNSRTINSFVGVKDHFQKFNLKQWQVYKLSYGKGEQLESSFIKHYQAISL